MAIYSDYIAAAIMYNLQILPESLITGIILLAIILANPTLVALAGGAVGTQLLASTAGYLMMKFGPIDEAKLSTSADMCNNGFIGKHWNRLLRGNDAPESLWHPAAPSIYTATVGYFFGVGLSLLQIYNEEINAQVMSRAHLLTTTIIGTVLVVATLLFRILVGCDSVLVAVTGLLLGLLVGYLGFITLAYLTDRRATNIWGIPLLKDRINNGSPLYICPTPTS